MSKAFFTPTFFKFVMFLSLGEVAFRYVFTLSEELKLFLNGKLLGKMVKVTYTSSARTIYFTNQANWNNWKYPKDWH